MEKQSWLGRIASTLRVRGSADKPREIDIMVRDRYQPGAIVAREGERLRLTFLRWEGGGCTREVVFPSLGIRKTLPSGTAVDIDLGPLPAGTVEFTCGMDMVRGRIDVKPAA
jgi:plastocyanin domain-containing protein